MKKQGFTLAEVLITLAIIGVVAAITIPSVVANTQQKEFQTGLRKAVSVLNSAITMNMAIDGETPYENQNLYYYLGRHMSIMKSNAITPKAKGMGDARSNAAFYTTDGMRFEFPTEDGSEHLKFKLYEDSNITLRPILDAYILDSKGNITSAYGMASSSRCGSYGLNSNTDSTTRPPCLVVVDVNGDRKPFPKNASCFGGLGASACAEENIRKFGDPSGTKLTDTFSIMITDKQAIPYGQAAQKAMYQAQSKKQ